MNKGQETVDKGQVPRRPLIAMRSALARDGIVISGPWVSPRRRRVDWGVVGAALFGGVCGYVFGVLSGGVPW